MSRSLVTSNVFSLTWKMSIFFINKGFQLEWILPAFLM